MQIQILPGTAALEDAYRWYKKSKEWVRAKNGIEM
jgi:hypothetical protein